MPITSAPLFMTSNYGFDNIRQGVRHGELTRMRHGAYLSTRSAEGNAWEARVTELMARCHAVAATLTAPFVFSHETAAFLHGWPGPVQSRVHMLQQFRPRPGMAPDIVRHYRDELPEHDVVQVKGLPVTSPSRTALQCVLFYPPSISLPIADAALRNMARVSRFEQAESMERQEEVRAALLERLACGGPIRHVRRARAVLEHANGFAESRPESWIRWVALSRGLPVPVLQPPISTTRGTLYPDAMWPDHGPVILEYDGMDKYEDGAAIGEAVVAQTDREQLLLESVGGEIVRFTRHDLSRDPEGTFRRLLRVFPPGVHLTPRPPLLERRVRP